ncbi:MAG: triose-phosphate isomerase [Candidatus Thermoplasmatota archaeon]|nr:triose-phosphate isomerase [Candidatus Thermoplasmatota archaeon]MBU4072403.1 triose-phosphate isomerase [Candidatus Thermoplasmatota archaeon]MBU4144938.1 triose-phosphate isomerase [Candidatus Thermoplasmatota archaeon]MBU4591693.1 triose-phosphate isomerase [Candidatus Thermoplasmatota archaeon]
MRTPLVAINMKTYPESSGPKGMSLTALVREVTEETGRNFAVAPQQCDLALYANSFGIPVFAQHADNVKQGSTTGRVTPEAIKAIGCAGTLINHSEYRISAADVEALVSRCKELGLITIVCTKDAEESRAYAKFNPDFIAVEPPELIGGDISVTTANPQIVSDSVKLVKEVAPEVKVLCGAGVKNGRDVAKAIELGADGVLLASGVVKAKDRKAVLLDLVSGM